MKKSFLFLTLLIPMLTHGQDTVVMGLKDCMQYAVEHSTKVRIQNADNDDARVARRDAVLTAFTPQVSGNTYAYYNFGRSIDPETNVYNTVTSFHNGYNLSAGIDLFNGFEAVNNLKITKTSQLMGKTKSQQIEDQICLATMEAYCNVIYFSELEKALVAQVETAEKAVQLAERQERLGQKSHADVVQMQADLAERQYQLTNCKNRHNDAVITLKDMMFWPIEEPLKVDNDFGKDMVFDMPEDIKSLVDNAKEIMPEVLLAEMTMNNARRSLRTARWQILPTLSLYGGFSTNYFTYPGMAGYEPKPYGDQLKNNRGEYVQLSLNIPIFNHLARHSNIARKRNAFERAEAEYQQSLQQVEAEVSRAVADRDGAADALRQAETRATLQHEAFNLNAKRFEQGLISSIEYQTASNTYLNALAEKLNAQMQHFIKKSVVMYYKGVPYLEQ
jgi:outer membrane protein